MRKSRASTLILTFVLLAMTSVTASAQVFTTLGDFGDGKGPTPGFMSPIQGRDGFLYGTTTNFGPDATAGTVFKASPGGITALYGFCFDECPEGRNPTQLVLAADGNFYGTTADGGSRTGGTMFKLTPSGTLTTLHSFGAWNGVNPNSGVIQAADGNFYGTTESGGANLYSGEVFKMTPQGVFSILYSFCALPNCADGDSPNGVIQGADGNFYGVTSVGGANNFGSIYQLTPQGVLTTLHSFDSTDGAYPGQPLVQANDGNFYGATRDGGNSSCTDGCGTVFKITPDGTFTSLHSFDSTDGASPFAALIQGTDGNLYGTTWGGGSTDEGTIYQITLGGNLTTLYTFCSQTNCTDGAVPSGGLMQNTSGLFYGTTTYGGNPNCGLSGFGCGTLFSLNMNLGPFVTFVNSQAKVGQSVEILGTGLSGTTAVSFNGTPATFKAVTETYLVATVPAGATTGPVTVTTASGTLTSNKSFVVIP
jgi:uncharacterized repeat protein (TIGR03803 family)